MWGRLDSGSLELLRHPKHKMITARPSLFAVLKVVLFGVDDGM